MGYTPPYLEVRRSTGFWSVYGPSSTSGDDLYINANTTDARPYILLLGNGGVQIRTATGETVDIYTLSTKYLSFAHTGTDAIIESIVNNDDLYLKTTGSGVLKFGTHTGSGDVACNGSILVKDAGGTARKLMTTA